MNCFCRVLVSLPAQTCSLNSDLLCNPLFLQLSVFRQNVTPVSKNVFEYNINNNRHCSICFVYLKHCRNYLCNLGGVFIDVDDSNDFPKIENQKMSDQ